MNQKGDIWSTILAIPVAVLIIMIAMTLLDPFAGLLFNTLDNASSDTILYVSTIKLLVGMLGLIIVAMYVASVIRDFRRPSEPV